MRKGLLITAGVFLVLLALPWVAKVAAYYILWVKGL